MSKNKSKIGIKSGKIMIIRQKFKVLPNSSMGFSTKNTMRLK